MHSLAYESSQQVCHASKESALIIIYQDFNTFYVTDMNSLRVPAVPVLDLYANFKNSVQGKQL